MKTDIFAGLNMLQDSQPDKNRTGLTRDLFFAPVNIQPAAERLLEAEYHLEDISGIDVREGILVSYHFDHYENPGRMALRVLVPHHEPSVPSIAHLYGGAEWHERELNDFYGVIFDGNPNPSPLLLPEAGVTAPLRKKEKRRKSMVDLIHPGKIVRKDEQFDYFAAADSPEAQIKEAEA